MNMYSYNQMAMEESSIYSYYLWIIVLTSPAMFFYLLIKRCWLKNTILRFYALFVICVFIMSFVQSFIGISASVDWILLLRILYPLLCAALTYTINDERIFDFQFLTKLSFVLWLTFVIVFLMGWTSINTVLNYTVRGMRNVYYILFAFPFCQCSNSKRIRVLTMIITGLLCVFSMKRGAMLGFGAMVIIYYLLNSNSKGFRKLLSVLLIIFIVFGEFRYFDNLSGNYISSRFTLQNAGDDSREDIYLNVLNALEHSSTSEFIFGHGSSSVKQITQYELSAHNDFLEIIFDYGIIALFLWVLFLYYAFREGMRKRKMNDSSGEVMISSLGIVLVVCIFSHFFFMAYSCALMLFWGASSSNNKELC